MSRLPNEIIALSNKDKKFHEKWKKGRNKANIQTRTPKQDFG